MRNQTCVFGLGVVGWYGNYDKNYLKKEKIWGSKNCIS